MGADNKRKEARKRKFATLQEGTSTTVHEESQEQRVSQSHTLKSNDTDSNLDSQGRQDPNDEQQRREKDESEQLTKQPRFICFIGGKASPLY